MSKKILIVALAALIVLALCGCSLMEEFGVGEAEPELIVNGTNTGNILNYGFGVQDGEELIFVYTKGGAYDLGSVVKSNPQTGENSLIMDDGGLYMNLVDGDLFYCKLDGIYKAAVDDPQPELVVGGKAEQLQISNGVLYYIMDGVVYSATMQGSPTDAEPIVGASCLNVYENALYYIDAQSSTVFSANLDGGDRGKVLEEAVDMFYIIDGVIYYIDADSGFIMRTLLDVQQREKTETVVEYPCSGFNVNRGGIYYTREIEGKSVCCNADNDGKQEKVIEDFGQSDWHVACMWNDGALVVRIEDLSDLM